MAGSQSFYHGTRADLTPGDLILPGRKSNFGQRKRAAYVYLTATLDAAIWGAELAVGEGPGRIYEVEPTGSIEDDPNLTDKKYPGNPTKSYRSREPLRVTGEAEDWEGHSPEARKAMKETLDRLDRLGIEAIEDGTVRRAYTNRRGMTGCTAPTSARHVGRSGAHPTTSIDPRADTWPGSIPS